MKEVLFIDTERAQRGGRFDNVAPVQSEFRVVSSESLSGDEIRRVLGIELEEREVEALAGWYAGFARGVAAFPAADLKRVEPPLRSVPGPNAR